MLEPGTQADQVNMWIGDESQADIREGEQTDSLERVYKYIYEALEKAEIEDRAEAYTRQLDVLLRTMAHEAIESHQKLGDLEHSFREWAHVILEKKPMSNSVARAAILRGRNVRVKSNCVNNQFNAIRMSDSIRGIPDDHSIAKDIASLIARFVVRRGKGYVYSVRSLREPSDEDSSDHILLTKMKGFKNDRLNSV